MAKAVALTADKQALARSRFKSTGFSHNTALPAFAAASISSEWVSVEVAIRTASMEESPIISSELTTFASYFAASSSAAEA